MSTSNKDLDELIVISTTDPRLRNTLEAWLKFGTVFLVYRIGTYIAFDLGRNDNPLFDIQSVQLVIFILIGFTLYYLLVKPYVPVPLEHPILRNSVNDTLMFGTVIVTSHFLESYMSNTPYFSQEWMKNSFLIILSFIMYDVLVNPFIPRQDIPIKDLPLVNDISKYGFFLIALRILEGKNILNAKWAVSVAMAMLGFVAYFYGTEKLIKVQY